MSDYLLTVDERMESISRSIDEINEKNRKFDALIEKCWNIIKVPYFCLIAIAVVGTIIEYLMKST